MNKSKISFYFIFIAFFTFIAIFTTILQASYSNLVDPQRKVEENKFLEPLNPNLDSDIIQEIEKRTNLVDSNEEIIISDRDQNTKNPARDSLSVTPTITPSAIVDDSSIKDSQSNFVTEENN